MSNEREILHLKGWPAVFVIMGVLAFGGWKLVSAHADLEDGATRKLNEWITAEYYRSALKHYKNSPELLMEKVREIEQLRFEEITARGTPDDMVVKVRVAPNPSEPAGTKHVRYFRMRHDTVTGWHLRREVDAVSWWLALI